MLRTPPPRPAIAIFGVIALLVLETVAGGARRVLAASAADPGPLAGPAEVVEVSQRADVAVVTYREVLGEIGESDRGPLLQVYGDGRVVSHYPAYMKRAGDYEQRLTRNEVGLLVRSLVAKGVLDFDPAATRAAKHSAIAAARQRAQASAAPVTVFEAADAATTVIEVAVERYEPTASSGRAAARATRRAVWTSLRSDAERHPDVAALRGLAAAEAELRALRERPGAVRVR